MAKFPYYKRLSAGQKIIYNKSDEITFLKLPQPHRFTNVIEELKKALEQDSLPKTKETTQRLISGLCTVYGVPKIKVNVLSKRPSKKYGELHGLYVAEEGKLTEITVWMRTAKRKDVVAFKTFLRTLIHEFLHHLDYTFLKLEDSLHTAGFFARESSLTQQLLDSAKAPLEE